MSEKLQIKYINNHEDHRIMKEFEQYVEDMNDPIARNYIKERVIEQIIWYDGKSIEKQKRYKQLMVISIIITSSLPVLALFSTYEKYGIVASIAIAILSASSTALLAVINLCEFQKLWIQYRSTCEILKSILHRYFIEKDLFRDRDDKTAFNALVTTCEGYMVKEYSTWVSLSHKDEENNKEVKEQISDITKQ